MVSTSTLPDALNEALGAVPEPFRERIGASYLEVKRRYRQARFDGAWDSSGLSAGKFCESVLRLLQEELTGTHIPFGQHIPNFAQECEKLGRLPKSDGNESLRVIIPRALLFLFTLRGKRGIGHVGGDVDANEIDAATTLRLCDWVLCELVRIFHSMSLEEAQALVDSLAARELPDVWEVGGRRRVLRPGLTYRDQTLVLLYSSTDGVPAEDLADWIDHPRLADFRRRVLKPLHDGRSIEYDQEAEMVYLSPRGAQEVEERLVRNGGEQTSDN